MSQNKCWYHPTREVITTCEHCRKPLCIDCWWHFSKKAVIICEHCKRPLCLECSHHPCPISKDLELQEDCKENNLLLVYVSKLKRLFRKNKCVFHPTRTGYYTCKYCRKLLCMERSMFLCSKYYDLKIKEDDTKIRILIVILRRLIREIKFLRYIAYITLVILILVYWYYSLSFLIYVESL